MDCEYFPIDEGSEGQIVEHISAVPPNINRPVFLDTLVVKPVALSNLSALVVASDQSYPIRIFHLRPISDKIPIILYLQRKQVQKGLDGLRAPIDVIPQK